MQPLHGASSILVFRALMLGDWLCATPALRALRKAAPRARLVVCGLPWTAALMQRLDTRLNMVDEFIAFPGHPALPERQPEPGAFEAFIGAVRQRRFDVALQLHGSGSVVNPLITSLGARDTAGFATPGTEAGLDLAVPWPEHGTEVERCLALTSALGARPDGLGLSFPLSDADRDAAAALRAAAGISGRYAIVHPGSQLPSRRWPPERFAAVADALVAQGFTVVLTGSPAEAPLAAAVQAAVQAATRHCLVDAAGRTPSLWTLGALVEAADLVVANDTGISHIAAALRTPSVIVASGSDVQRWAPADHQRHRVLWHAVPCRPCGHAVCPTAHECANGVATSAVLDAVLDILHSNESPAPCPTPLAACAS